MKCVHRIGITKELDAIFGFTVESYTSKKKVKCEKIIVKILIMIRSHIELKSLFLKIIVEFFCYRYQARQWPVPGYPQPPAQLASS